MREIAKVCFLSKKYKKMDISSHDYESYFSDLAFMACGLQFSLKYGGYVIVPVYIEFTASTTTTLSIEPSLFTNRHVALVVAVVKSKAL